MRPMKIRYRRSWCTNWVWRSIIAFLLSFFALVVLVTFYNTEAPSSTSRLSSSSSNADQLFIEKMKLEMSKRRKIVDDVCSREGLGRFAMKGRKPSVRHPPIPNYEAFYFDKKDRLAWCPVYKCGSTSWLYNLCLLSGLTDQQIQESKIHISELARKLYPQLEFEDGQKAMNDSQVKFFMVRHPFQRILSAYRDKLENKNVGKKHGTLHYYRKYGSKIVKKYRKKSPIPHKENEYNFPNRYQQVIEREVKSNTSDDPSAKDLINFIPPDGSEPTFKEFVTYLTEVDLSTHGDDHWMPYYLYCTPCLIQYDVIAKLETLVRDQKYLIKLARLDDRIQPQWKHLTKGRQTSQVVKNYYSTISKELLMKLYDKYRLDFEMFEYIMDEYLNYVQ